MNTGSLFENFVNASTLKSIQVAFYQLCIGLDVDHCDSLSLYSRLRQFKDWRAEKLWKLLDKRFERPEYCNQRACNKLNVLIIGAGPCGLRSAIECALLGSKVVVLEQREKFSRNNVLHLWEFVIHDLKGLGAKVFYPKFCTGSIEHISIRQLQCILLKVALCFGVQVHEGVSFSELMFPDEENGTVRGFRAKLDPAEHILSNFEFDILLGADGKRNSVPGFQRDEMRGKLAIAITANFINKRTHAEERVPEISGVSYIFNQTFFKEMYATTGVDLENIVYYKDETHYFVMCAKKQSLLDAGVIKMDYEDVNKLLSSNNIDNEALCNYARAAANFATNGNLPSLDFAKNHRGLEDIAVFDFTSLFSSKNSVRLVERSDKRLIMGIVGDTLHEPFWPTGSGCARGFLGVFDTAWLIRQYGLNMKGPLELISERESIYRLLAQVTKDNMNKMLNRYSIDPKTRYVSLDLTLGPTDVVDLVNSDNPRTLDVSKPLPLNNTECVHSSTPELLKYAVWKFIHFAVLSSNVKVINLSTSFDDGICLAALVFKFRPELGSLAALREEKDVISRLEKLFTIVTQNIGVEPPCDASDWKNLDENFKIAYIGAIVGILRENPHNVLQSIVSPSVTTQKRKAPNPQLRITRRKTQPIQLLAESLMNAHGNSDKQISGKPIPTGSGIGFFETSRELFVTDEPTYTNRPVEKLNPDLVNKVDKMVSGAVFKQQEDRVDRTGTKIDKLKIDRIEQKLQDVSSNCPRTENLSSQDEMIMRVAAADARKEAVSGFTKDDSTSRFKKYDDVIQKSENVLKTIDVIGIDPFQRNLAPGILQRENSLNESSKPPANPADSIVFRSRVPIAAVAPKRHSVPVVSNKYETTTASRQNECELCGKVVYLAERMLVESFYIHKNCFRCVYCNQPLRLGEYGKDKDVEHHYKNKFFCNIHLKVSLREKLAKIERTNQKLRNVSSQGYDMDVSGAPATSKDRITGSHVAHLSFYSPELMDKNLESVPPMGRSAYSDDSCDEEEQFSSNSNNIPKELEEDSLSECEALEEDDLAELESTIIEIADQQPEKPLTDEQVISVIDRLNQRRCVITSPEERMTARSPLVPMISLDESLYFTPETEAKPRSHTTSICTEELSRTEDNIRQRKQQELQKLRDQFRLRAQQKTDEELGLESNQSVSSSKRREDSIDVKNLEDIKISALLPEVGGQVSSTSETVVPRELSQTPTRSTGMLSQLFSPSKLKNPSASPTPVHSESKKETSILGSAFRRLRLKRGESPQLTVDSDCASPIRSVDSSRVAAVAPSPRLPIEENSPTTHISVNEKNLKMFHKKAEKIIRQHMESMPRTAQELHRLIEQNEFRLQSIAQAGLKCENILRNDPFNRCELECWLALVREHEVLKNVDTDNRNRLRKIELKMKYRELNLRYAHLDGKMADRELLSQMLAVVNERDQLDKDLEGFSHLSLKRYTSIKDAMASRKYDYRNFDPVFIK